jgi:hypothetical protein
MQDFSLQQNENIDKNLYTCLEDHYPKQLTVGWNLRERYHLVNTLFLFDCSSHLGHFGPSSLKQCKGHTATFQLY